MENDVIYQGYETEQQQLFEASKKTIENKLEADKYEIHQRFMEGFDLLSQLVVKKQEEDKAYVIKYIQISLLRSLIGMDRFIYRISAHNVDYFLDRQAEAVTIDLSDLFHPLAETGKSLREYVKSNRMGILGCHINYQIMEQAFMINRTVAKRFRFWLRDLDHTDALLNIKTTEYYFVKWGGHWEKSETILIGDKREKNQQMFEEIQEDNHIDQLDFSKFFHVWDKADFHDLVVTEKSLLFQRFRHTGFKRCVLGGTTLWGSNFRAAHIQRSVFLASNLSRCDFRDAVLEEVLFQNCDLCEADFRNADFREVSFEGSSLKGALFWRKDIPFLHLDNRQLQEIVMLKMEVDRCILL